MQKEFEELYLAASRVVNNVAKPRDKVARESWEDLERAYLKAQEWVRADVPEPVFYADDTEEKPGG